MKTRKRKRVKDDEKEKKREDEAEKGRKEKKGKKRKGEGKRGGKERERKRERSFGAYNFQYIEYSSYNKLVSFHETKVVAFDCEFSTYNTVVPNNIRGFYYYLIFINSEVITIIIRLAYH